MKRISIIILLAGLSLLSGCLKDVICIRGEGMFYEETRDVGEFDQIELRISADIYLTQGDYSELVIEGQDNILDELVTYISGTKLIVDFNQCVVKHDGLKIFATVQTIKSIQIPGSGTILNETPLSADYLDVSISGSGDLELTDFSVKELTTSISGSGNFYIASEDTANSFHIRIPGSGRIRGFEFPVKHVTSVISGSGFCEINALESLIVDISGSGDVYYRGNPTITQNITGSGRIIPAN